MAVTYRLDAFCVFVEPFTGARIKASRFVSFVIIENRKYLYIIQMVECWE